MVQVNNTKLFLRFRFVKTGRLQYISHLDLVRTMHKIIVRADLPLWYTEGFNPKPKIIFAAPLSIGTESISEFMDIRMKEYIDPAVAMARLNSNMTPEMQIVEAYYPETKFTDLKWLDYRITLRTTSADADMAKRVGEYLLGERVLVVKKNSESESDIRPLIHSASSELREGEIVINCRLSADPSAFLNPEYIIKALRGALSLLSSENLLDESYDIMRLEGYDADMAVFR